MDNIEQTTSKPLTPVFLPRRSGPLILVNTTTLNRGGALQISMNFIKQVLQDPAEFRWCFALSQQVNNELIRAGVKLPDETEIFPISPARDNEARLRLRRLADRWKPDGVFTFAGPAYVDFKQPHLLGCMACWVTHGGWNAYRTISFPREWCYTITETLYKIWWFRGADMWYTETEQSRQGMASRFWIPADRVHVISNSCGSNYFNLEEHRSPFPEPGKKLRIFSFCAAYKHKNLIILPRVAAELKKLEPGLQFEFVVTLPKDGTDWLEVQQLATKLGVEDCLHNHGPVPVTDGPQLYQTCDFLLLPTILETFSGTYPEAMAMGLPIITTDLDFAHEICQDAALFYSPFDALAAAKLVQQLIHDNSLWNRLIDNGKRRLKDFPRPVQRKDMYLELLRKLIQIRK
jgi:glycosyltransferase involved in cell wall biosynthesis